MKPSKTLTILTLVAAVVGGGGYAYVASQRTSPQQADQTVATAEADASATPTPTASPTATPAVSTNLEQETSVLENEFNAVSEADFSTSDLNDSSLGL